MTNYLLLKVARRTHFHSGHKKTNRENKPLQFSLIQADCSNKPVNGFIKTFNAKYLNLASTSNLSFQYNSSA